MALTSPYNFVPLNKNVYIPDWYNLVSQDMPFEDGEDGYIELTWHNDSPLFIRNGAKELPDGKPNVEAMCHDGRYFIPGSSIKGMLRNVLSILAFGKMAEGEQYKDRFFGHREIGSGQTDSSDYHEKMDNAKCGWLELDKNSTDGKEHYLLYPCDGDLSRIYIDESKDKKQTSQHYVRDYCKAYDRGRTSWERNETIKKALGKWFPELPEFPGYRLFSTGRIGTKKKELLIPAKTKDPIELEDNVVSKFFDVYEPSPNFEKYKDLLDRKNERIPVLYVEDNGSIIALGMGRMFRYPYNQGIKDIVEKEQDPDNYAGQRDLCETIFGWIGDNSAKGRVQFSNAWAKNEVPDDRDETKGVLGQPKASFYPLYIKQERSPKIYKSYSSKNIQISGRKRYRIHKGSSTMNLPQGNGNEKTKTSFKAIPAGNDFKMRINVHNLRPVEIGALLSAITFHNVCGVFHNIGAAKSFGYGKLHCDAGQIRLFGLKKSFIEYLKDFECQMNVFCSNIDKPKAKAWRDTIQVMRLLGVMSEHGEGLEMMKLEDYTKSKDTKGKGQIVVLKEKERSPETIVDNNDLKLRLFSVTIQSITDKLQYIIAQKQTKDTDKLAQLKCLCSNVKDAIASMRSLGAEVSEYTDVIAEIAEQVRFCEIKCKTPQWNKQIENIKASMVLSNEANGVLSIKCKAQEVFNEMTKYKADTSVVSVLIKDIDNRINQLKVLAFRAKYAKEYAEAQAVYDRIEGKTMSALKAMDLDVTTAISLYEKIISMLRRDGLEDSIVTDRIMFLRDKKAKIERMLVESDSLRTRLEAKQGEKYAVRDWKVCSKKIEQWNKAHELSADDKDAIEETVCRLFAGPTREEKERWTKRDSHIWKSLEVYLGKERADELFTELNSGKQS